MVFKEKDNEKVVERVNNKMGENGVKIVDEKLKKNIFLSRRTVVEKDIFREKFNKEKAHII